MITINEKQKMRIIESMFQKKTGINPRQIRQNMKLESKLNMLPFWCGNKTKHKKNPDTYQLDYCCVNHVIGLPNHISKGISPLTPYQIDFYDQITKNRKKAKSGNKIHLNKARQIGMTDIVLRIILFESLHSYAGKNIVIMAGNTGSLAREDLRRLYDMYKPIKDIVLSYKENQIKLHNGTVITAYSASEESATGRTFIACVFLDEASKWKLVDDEPVINSILPIVETNKSDLFLVSTPKGQVKSFYKIWKDPKDFKKIEYDIYKTQGNLYTKKEIEHILKTFPGDVNQEFLCKFTISDATIFGDVTQYMKDDKDEWTVNL